MTVEHLTTTMSAIELEEWKQYMSLQKDDAQGDELASSAQQGLQNRVNALRG